MSGGRETALKVTKALNIPVPNIDRWSDFGRKALAPPPNVTAKLREGSIAAVEDIIGHKFSRPHLLAQALVRGPLIRDIFSKPIFLSRHILRYKVTRQLPMNDSSSSAMPS